MPRSKKKWSASTSKEKRKLGVAEEGWNLAGSGASTARTRGGSKKTVASNEEDQSKDEGGALPVEDVAVAALVPTAEDDEVSTLTTSTSRSRSYSPHHLRKPAASRVILDTAPLKSMLENHLSPCPHCRSRLVVTFPTTCIASGCQIRCPLYSMDGGGSKFVATSAPEVTKFVTQAVLILDATQTTQPTYYTFLVL